MKTRIIGVVLSCLMIVALALTASQLSAAGKKAPQYGGTITRQIIAGPISWDIARANWSASYWAGTHLEKLLEGNVDKMRSEGLFISRYHPYSAVRLASTWPATS